MYNIPKAQTVCVYFSSSQLENQPSHLKETI